jgi:hypothetical protein
MDRPADERMTEANEPSDGQLVSRVLAGDR